MNEYDLIKGLSDIDEGYIEEARNVKKKKNSRTVWMRLISAAAALCLVVSLLWPHGGGALSVQAVDLMEGITARPVGAVDLMDDKAAVTDFAVRLLQASNQSGKNTMISPISVLYALAMTANGAKGETLAEMEAVLGMPVEELNGWLYSYAQTINVKQLKLANSIWFTEQDGFTVNRSFLQKNADYYGADIFQAPFDDTTLEDINNWVSHHTDGMIPKMLNEFPDNAVMCLINALCFDAKWANEYRDDQVEEKIFTRENGTKVSVDFLNSTEGSYLEDDLGRGFIKYYEGGQYAFAAILPNQGVTVSQYLESLTGEHLTELLEGVKAVRVQASMPKFESDFSLEMSEALKEMGMELAFDPDQADFSGLWTSADGNICIDQVQHKTYICVDEEGTKAAASTAVIMVETTAAPRQETVVLDRPFVYLIVDMDAGIPVFVGTMMDPSK